jgi:hypothetical protein
MCNLQNHQPLSSAYGLAKHRDGRWEWAIAPGVSPSPRYQHAAVSYCSISSICYYIFQKKLCDPCVTLTSCYFLGFCECTASCVRWCSGRWADGRRLFKCCRLQFKDLDVPAIFMFPVVEQILKISCIAIDLDFRETTIEWCQAKY